MNGYDAAKLYNAVKLHFNSESYNAIKYRFKTKTTFVPENQFYAFQKLSNLYKENLTNFYVSNFIDNPKYCVFDLLSPECEETYKKWKKRQDALSYVYKTEMSELLTEYELNELLTVKKTYPIFMTEVMREKVSLDTLLISDCILQFFKDWEKNIKEEIIWGAFKMKCEKYRSFMNIDLPKMKEILKMEVKNALAK